MDCGLTLNDFFYSTDVEGKEIWMAKFKDKDDYVPILFCPFCGEPLMKKNESEGAGKD